MYVCIMSGVELMHDSMVGMGTCGPRVSTSRSGGETTAASHSEDSLVHRVQLPICVYVLNGYSDDEQCFHSHLHFRAKVTL